MNVEKLSIKRIYVLSFLIPVIIFMVVGVLLKLYPIGDNTVLFSDMNNQFVSFYTYFKNMCVTNNNIFYTFSKNLGGDMIGFAAYYLTNPYLFILFLFPNKYLPTGIYIMEILMLATAGLTMQLFFVNVYKRSNLAFSTAYSMMGYVLAYFTLPIYFCNIILLPLVMMGLHNIINSHVVDTNKKNDVMFQNNEKQIVVSSEIHSVANYVNRNTILYIICLATSIITNYYIGYMLCLFLVLYFVYLCIDKNIFSIRVLIGFVINSMLGVMLSCVYLIPVALSLRGQKNAPDTSIMSLRTTFRITGFYSSFIPCSFSGDYSNYAFPYVYIGIVAMLFVAYFFISRSVSIREKIAAAFIVLSMFVCLYVHPLNVIWHAFNEPVGFAHRFAFYLSFVLIEIGFKGYSKVNLSGIVKIVPKIMCGLLILELFVNAYHTLKIQVDNATPQSKYEAYYNNLEPTISAIKQFETQRSGEDTSLYRIEKDFQYNMEDAMTYDYIGLTHNSSCETETVKNFMGKMGFRNQGIWAFYNQGSTAFADSFLGVKYFVSKYDTSEKLYKENGLGTNGYFTFENEYALPLGSFVNSEKIKAVDLTTDNLFEIQNEIASAYNFDKRIYNEANVSEVRICGNVELSDDFRRHLNDNHVVIKEVTMSDDSTEGGTYVAGNGYIEFEVEISEDDRNLYMYFTAPTYQGARIYVDGLDWEEYFSDWRWAIEKAGRYNAGRNVPIRLVSTADKLTLSDYFLYEEDLSKLAQWYNDLSFGELNNISLHKISSSHIKGTYTCDREGELLFTIPYDKGWHIKVDGKSVKQREELSALMAIDVTGGTHEIEMIYVPQGLLVGAIVTVITMILGVTVALKTDGVRHCVFLCFLVDR